MVKVFGHPKSTCTRKVLMTLEETGTAYEMNVVDLPKGEQKAEAHLRRQPFGRVPAIDDDGFELFESRAIMRYLAEKASTSLAPRDLQARAVVEQWISVETWELTPHAMKFVYEHVFKRPQGADVLEKARASLQTTLGVMDRRLAASTYFAGPTFTIADVSFMPYVEYAMKTPVKELFDRHEHVTRWWTDVSARPSWRKAIGK